MTTQSHLYKQDDEMNLPTCCQYHGFEEGGCNGRNCPEGRVDLTDPNYMMFITAICGLVSVAVIVGGLAWLAYAVWPVLRAHFA